ncbi:MAG: 3-oxoacyl-ACP reductase [Candidatus Thermofonsia Clade 1 bacterium]|jgi:3-oxoacyl-[acyl-carrier protein] reductase|uniref:3-oxoacyl-ACP reductase n=1 Tax=Candidatus Thermofonsia Clade 1 bacterium TaxID=2364210 RepID=A0A2M8PYF8_9CHLR|nr:MAG: 3-oxoacyl-ACP reductase [Candidatus Thermofonsia Clade 1 bacterium]PJF42550.1 MAG: 3-oxoacyl-ACP reductase [Candidatus Thermofonsia Clade 1 bacterium]RMF52865.1 MAG: SDR family oxidoreductase [Chloroflexota bacterium]
MDLGLKDKVALIAAASKGLGYGVARAMGREGAHLSICSRDAEQVRRAAEKLSAETGAQVLAVPCDVRDAAAIEAWIAQTVARWGRIDALLVNAGGPPAMTFKETTDAHWQAAFELTLLSAIRLIRAALPHMSSGSAILTITSSSIKEPIERLGLSTVMRAGVAGLVKTLADELASDGIRINNLIPGRIDTDRVAQLDQNTASVRGITFEQARAEAVSKIPLRRLGTIDEFGAAAAFLLSPAASYITGATLRIDGGAMRSI